MLIKQLHLHVTVEQNYLFFDNAYPLTNKQRIHAVCRSTIRMVAQIKVDVRLVCNDTDINFEAINIMTKCKTHNKLNENGTRSGLNSLPEY